MQRAVRAAFLLLFALAAGPRVWARIIPADFNGDGRSEIVIYRAGAWFFWENFGSTAPDRQVWTGPGTPDCLAAPGDFDGDGDTDMAVFCSGAWHFFHADGSYWKGIWTGGAADIPVPADYDGDGKDEAVVFRGNGAWIAFDFDTGAQAWAVWTGPGMLSTQPSRPVPGDWDGDGSADLTVWNPWGWGHRFAKDGTYLGGFFAGWTNISVVFAADIDVDDAAPYGDGKDDFVVFTAQYWGCEPTPCYVLRWHVYDPFTSKGVSDMIGWALMYVPANPNGGPVIPIAGDFQGHGGVCDLVVWDGGAVRWIEGGLGWPRDRRQLATQWTTGVPGAWPVSKYQAGVNP